MGFCVVNVLPVLQKRKKNQKRLSTWLKQKREGQVQNPSQRAISPFLEPP
jgi:hypothetical protein